MNSTQHASKQWWLMKSEPEEFSIDDLAARGSEPWNGIRNYQARNYLRAMQVGDGVWFYHSSCPVPGIVGIARIDALAEPDPSQFDPNSKYYDARSPQTQPRWLQVQVGYVRHTRRILPLAELKTHAALAALPLLARGNRLSVIPVPLDVARYLLNLESLGIPHGE